MPATRLVEQAINYKLLDVHLNRISDIALSQPEGADRPSARKASSRSGGDRAQERHLPLRRRASRDVLQRASNLKIEPGEMVALVGPSGGGKTTLLKIMMGLFQPSHGEVLVDGRPLAGMAPERLAAPDRRRSARTTACSPARWPRTSPSSTRRSTWSGL